MPASIEPMKATHRRPVLRSGEEWLFEIKWDGVRAIAFVEDEEVRLHLAHRQLGASGSIRNWR